MKRSVLLGLFVTASMLASSSFAAGDDLCATNLQAIANAKTQTLAPEIKTRVEASVQQAKAYQAQNTEEGTKNASPKPLKPCRRSRTRAKVIKAKNY